MFYQKHRILLVRIKFVISFEDRKRKRGYNFLSYGRRCRKRRRRDVNRLLKDESAILRWWL